MPPVGSASACGPSCRKQPDDTGASPPYYAATATAALPMAVAMAVAMNGSGSSCKAMRGRMVVIILVITALMNTENCRMVGAISSTIVIQQVNT